MHTPLSRRTVQQDAARDQDIHEEAQRLAHKVYAERERILAACADLNLKAQALWVAQCQYVRTGNPTAGQGRTLIEAYNRYRGNIK